MRETHIIRTGGATTSTRQRRLLSSTASVWAMTLIAMALGAAPVRADESSTNSTVDPAQIETTADKLNYDREHGIVEGIGNVVITRGDVILEADYVRVNVKTEDAHAFGNVVLTRGSDVWEGPSLSYNFKNKDLGTRNMKAEAKPFKMIADSTEKGADGVFVLDSAAVTTCERGLNHPHFRVTAGRFHLLPDEYLKARNAVWWMGRVPVMYVPYWYRNLRDDFGWSFTPGHSSRMGTFLLTSYRYRINQGLVGKTHLDYRSERGVGVGQDFSWNTGIHKQVGSLTGYFIDDDKPIDDDEDLATSDIENARYRVRFQDLHAFSERKTLLTRVHYLSDTDITEDFFEDEYRDERQPDNYASYTHRADRYTGNLIVRSRVNDFYDSLNRLPEASVDFFRQPLGDSSLYYEGVTAAAFLEQEFAESANKDPYDTTRIDSHHTLYRPDKHFGFLTVIPRVGVRGTYYSVTRMQETISSTTASVSSNTVVDAMGMTNIVVTTSVSTNAQVRDVAAGAEFRSSYELGFETSFKAFRVWNSAYGPRRHIVEPFANYTFIPEPSVTPDALFQFDEIDELDEQHTVRLGVRNKYQAKTDDGPWDMIDVEVSTVLDLDPDENEDSLDLLLWDAEFRPDERVLIESDGRFSLAESELRRFNVWVVVRPDELYEARAEYRYRLDDSSLIQADVTLLPEAPWSLNLYGRYEAEESRTEEVGAWLQRNFDCIAFRVGANSLPGYTRSDGTLKEDETRILFEFWLTAFPETSFGGKHRN